MGGNALKPLNLLLVEDNAAVGRAIAKSLRAQGHTVTLANSYAEARATTASFDVGIFDIKLARGNGIDALVEARRRVPGLVGIVMSNYATPQHRKASADAGAAYFLDKSADFERITEILSALSGGKTKGASK